MNKNGVVLEERGNRVVIATGLTKKSSNAKTGGMIQIYILHRHESPVDAVKSGADYANCGDCKHRSRTFKKRACFVTSVKAHHRYSRPIAGVPTVKRIDANSLHCSADGR